MSGVQWELRPAAGGLREREEVLVGSVFCGMWIIAFDDEWRVESAGLGRTVLSGSAQSRDGAKSCGLAAARQFLSSMCENVGDLERKNA